MIRSTLGTIKHASNTSNPRKQIESQDGSSVDAQKSKMQTIDPDSGPTPNDGGSISAVEHSE